MSEKQEWKRPKGRIDAHGRPELFMHPDIMRGSAEFRVTRRGTAAAEHRDEQPGPEKSADGED